MGVFRFKRFEVSNERSAMKVNTDGVLLGAVTEVFPADKTVLDIGTGTGTIALMAAQKLADRDISPNIFTVKGIDIDFPSAEEAALNFRNSPWSRHMAAERIGFTAFSERPGLYDIILSNPPYYDNSLQAPDKRRNAARHVGGAGFEEQREGKESGEEAGDNERKVESESLSYREIAGYAAEHLAPNGRLSVILPADQEQSLLRHARSCGLFPWKLMRIRTVEHKQPSRIIVQFRPRLWYVALAQGSDGQTNLGQVFTDGVSFIPPAEVSCGAAIPEPIETELTLLDKEGRRTSQHASLVTDYLL